MAKIKNTGGQPRGFNTEEGSHVIVRPGEEREFNMTEADFKHLQETMEGLPDPKPFEVSGSHGGVKASKDKSVEDEMPAQSTEPPPSQTHQEDVPPPVTPMTEKERREQSQRGATPPPRSKQDDDDEETKRPARGR
jgi:hypothetical protein